MLATEEVEGEPAQRTDDRNLEIEDALMLQQAAVTSLEIDLSSK